MSGMIAATVGVGLVGSMMASDASQSAADTQAQAAGQSSALQAQTTREQLAQQKAMYDQNVTRLQPWVTSGTNASNQLSSLMGDGGALTKNFGSGDLGLDPSYQFRLQQGNQGLAASAAARGGLLTGQGAKDISDYNQGAASQEYQAAYNRYVNNQNNLYNRLSGLSSLGENAGAQVGNNGVQVATNMANTAQAGTAAQNAYTNAAAQAQAAGTIGSSNAWTSGLNSTMQNVQYLNNLNSPTSQYAPGTQAPAPVIDRSTYYTG